MIRILEFDDAVEWRDTETESDSDSESERASGDVVVFLGCILGGSVGPEIVKFFIFICVKLHM